MRNIQKSPNLKVHNFSTIILNATYTFYTDKEAVQETGWWWWWCCLEWITVKTLCVIWDRAGACEPPMRGPLPRLATYLSIYQAAHLSEVKHQENRRWMSRTVWTSTPHPVLVFYKNLFLSLFFLRNETERPQSIGFLWNLICVRMCSHPSSFIADYHELLTGSGGGGT